MSDFLTSLINSDSLLVGTFLPFLVVLTLVVFVHEMGHYLVGRWCGIGVQAFSVGFGPELIGFNDRHGTRWKLSAIPLGGYVKFAGDENGASIPDREALDKMAPEERERAFHSQPVWKRAATVFAGPFANFVLTFVIFATFFALYGKIVAEPLVSDVIPDSPAAMAGLKAGDRFVRVDDVEIDTFDDVQRMLIGRAGEPIHFVMARDGKEFSATITPETREIDDPLGNKVKTTLIGVKLDRKSGAIRIEKLNVVQAFGSALDQSLFIAQETGNFIVRLVKGREDKCQLGGPVKIATMAGQAAKRGIDWLIQLAAMLSIGIGLLNLLPIPPLDGGHLLLYGIESVQGRPVSAKVQDVMFRIGGSLVLMFMLFVFYNDLFACR